MSEQARELAELMGWHKAKSHKDYPDKFDEPVWWSLGGLPYADDERPDYGTDLNAMREVWAALKERGLWIKFFLAWERVHLKPKEHAKHLLRPFEEWSYNFLNDLPGQVTAAIKVLKEGK